MPKTHVDWFGFRAKDTPDVMAMALSEVVPEHMAISLSKRKTGWRSFESSFDVWLTDTRGNPETDCCRVGMAMTGGEAVKGWSMLSLSGEGCGWVTDWGRAMDVCTDQLPAFELKRVDLALDRFDGSHWHEVDAAWAAGEFCPPGGAKSPRQSLSTAAGQRTGVPTTWVRVSPPSSTVGMRRACRSSALNWWRPSRRTRKDSTWLIFCCVMKSASTGAKESQS